MGGLKQAAKAACAAALHHSGARRVLAAAARFKAGGRRTLILAYHRVVQDFHADSQRVIPGLLVSAETFARHLEEVRRGFDIVPLAEALEVNAGLRQPRRDVAVISFDDGYRDNFDVAFPILKQLGVPATIFLPTGFIGTDARLPHDRLFHLLRLVHARARREPAIFEWAGGVDAWAPLIRLDPVEAVERFITNWPHAQVLAAIDALATRLNEPAPPLDGALLDWEQCRTLQRSGLVSFGAHTVGHVPLPRESAASIARELGEAKATVERELGAPCRDFAYPNGFYSRELMHALVHAGYRSAVTTEDAQNELGGDPFRLRRKTLWENHSRGLFGGHSDALLGCQVDSVFGTLGLQRPVVGDFTPGVGAD
ncbi:MAG: polysaccharide deacetylase family protein [Deltaproteobacteria bacterium]|nr:polysaccharide deacetylase family protein [Deltaproteobacteria bacterium]